MATAREKRGRDGAKERRRIRETNKRKHRSEFK